MSTYGTVNHNSHLVRDNGGNDSEVDALLPGKTSKSSASKRLRRHLNVNVSKKHGDLILLLCYIITGLLDSCATAVWGSFVSMQTGNTVYIGLGLADPSGGTRWIKSGTSLILFALGSFCFARFHRYFGPKKRWVLTASFIIQVVLIVIAAFITTFSPRADKGSNDLHWHVLVPIGMIAFQSSGQAVTSRALSYGGLTSVVLTSIYCDLFSDAQLFASLTQNIERNRRAAAPLLLLVGAFLGGQWAKTEIGVGGALWTAAVLKSFIIVAWLLWKADPEDDSA